MVDSNRVIPGGGILSPAGNVELDPEREKSFRREIVMKALKSLEYIVKICK